MVSLLSWWHEVKKIRKKRNVQMISSIFSCPLVSVVFLCHYDNVRNIKYWITLSKKHYEERKESNGRPYFFSVFFFFGIASLSSQRWGTNCRNWSVGEKDALSTVPKKSSRSVSVILIFIYFFFILRPADWNATFPLASACNSAVSIIVSMTRTSCRFIISHERWAPLD